ncbi:hypothetical protein [Rubripirellula reticaptiva]|uniref:hypothetical protein n=1 Tax=Rubripirellula reticaptiva TaxID=2528013 RepID=UPI0011B4A714|nr:hypothetical protein [Rubripirellula reticaptiva]
MPDSVESHGYLFARTSRRTSGRQAVSLPGMESADKFSGAAFASGSAVARVDHGAPSSVGIASCAPRPSVTMHQKTRRFSTNNVTVYRAAAKAVISTGRDHRRSGTTDGYRFLLTSVDRVLGSGNPVTTV